MPSEPDFSKGPILIDNATGKIAMQWGPFYDKDDPEPHIGSSRVEAELEMDLALGKHMFPQHKEDYVITWAGLLESQKLKCVICTPYESFGVLPPEWLDENSILSKNRPDLG
jgi:hypothetical protein